MVLHLPGLAAVVIEHLPLRGDPGDPAIQILVQFFQEPDALLGHYLGRYGQFSFQLPDLYFGEIGTGGPQEQDHAAQHHSQHQGKHGPEQPPGHWGASIR